MSQEDIVPPAEQQQDRCCASMGDSQLKPVPGKTRAEAERLQLCLLPPSPEAKRHGSLPPMAKYAEKHNVINFRTCENAVFLGPQSLVKVRNFL